MRRLADGHLMRREETLVKCPKEKEWREGICYDVLREPEAIFRGKEYGYEPKLFLYDVKYRRPGVAEDLLDTKVEKCVGT